MTTARSERPRYFEGQYIGAADLEAAVDYARELAREGCLGGQTWGICIGLDLVEVANATGSFDYFVLPGMAFDGYGRPIVVLSPAPVQASLFAGMPTGNQTVWIRYDEMLNHGLRPGWESCDAGDAYARVRESFAIEAGPMSAVKDRQSGLDIAGAHVDDARLGLISVDADGPLVCDSSMPHQTFPADSARWLVPLGVASWTAGAPGSLGQRSAAAKKVSRTLRRYVGQVAESVYAADGVLRLRDRLTNHDSSATADAQCARDMITVDDLTNSLTPGTGAPADRLVGNELVWVEGNMRVTGDARLWGTKLELRKADGTDGGVPLYIDRGATLNANGGADLEIALGAAADGKTRLVAGIATPGALFTPKLQLENDGRLAVGTTIPADVKTHTILATTDGDTSSAIASAANKLAKLQFAVGPTLLERAHLGFDDGPKKLRLGVGTDLSKFIYVTAAGKVGVQTDSPELLDSDANDLVVNSVANAGMTLLCAPGFSGRIDFADDPTKPARCHAGSVLYNSGANRMEIWTNSAFRIGIDSSGNLGVGTMAPGARVEIDSLTDARSLKLDANQIQADNGGAASQLSLQRNGGGTLFGGSLGTDQQIFIGANGRIGIGTTGPAASIHARGAGATIQIDTTSAANAALRLLEGGVERGSLEIDSGTNRTLLRNNFTTSLVAENGNVGINIGNGSPVANLHVRGSIAGASSNPGNHVAFIENTAGADADVLALSVGVANPDGSNRFITFFGSGSRVGRIQGTGATGISFETGNADFAECLIREPGASPIGPSRIVGVRGGTVSLSTKDADALLVTTSCAAVVGNVPHEREEDWERVALVGQVPVMVEGPVAAGDYIVASGRDDGTGIALARDCFRPTDLPRTVGRAWESSEETKCRRILVAIGIGGSGDAVAEALSRQESRIEKLQSQLEALTARLGA